MNIIYVKGNVQKLANVKIVQIKLQIIIKTMNNFKYYLFKCFYDHKLSSQLHLWRMIKIHEIL